MQLKKQPRLRQALATATCTLLGAPVHAAIPWQIDSAVMYYSESDRVRAIEPVVSASAELDEDNSVSVKVVYDSLTGASPNGATPSDQPQTFTSPSGESTYTTKAGEIPLDETFSDTRVSVSGSWKRAVSRLSRLTLGLNASKESDFTSVGASAGWERDFNQKNTTLSVAAAVEADRIEPRSGLPVPFGAMPPVGSAITPLADSDDKLVTDLLVSVTQVINRNFLANVSYSLSASDGYHTDPYKILSVVDGTTGDTTGYLFENRPDTRLRQSLFLQGKYMLGDQVLDLSYRFMTDDWDVTSHTVDFRYFYPLGGGHYLEPHLRTYQQSATDFFRHSLIDGEPLPNYASADPRLADFTGQTIGLKYGFDLGKTQKMAVRVEYYNQTGDSSPSDAVGLQRNLDLFPDLTATIVQLNYSLVW